MSGPVLICYDGSDDARHAIRRAGSLMRERAAVVLHAWRRLSDELAMSVPLEPNALLIDAAATVDDAGREAADRLAAEGTEVARHGTCRYWGARSRRS